MKTSLTATKPTGISIHNVLKTLCSTPIGPNLPSPHEILLNHTNYRPGMPSTSVDLEQVRDYFITKKAQQKVQYDKRHRAQQLDDLEPGKDVLFLSPINQTSYLEGTVIGQAQMPRSYYIEAHGYRYRNSRQHICPINTHINSPFSRLYTDTMPQAHTNTAISLPPFITRPLLPPKEPKFIQSTKIPQQTPLALALHPNNATHLTKTSANGINLLKQVTHTSCFFK